MRLWRKHPDLCVIGALLAGLFAFQHGEAALAAVGPRFLAVKNVVTAKLAEFVPTVDAIPAEDVTVVAGDAASATVGSNRATQAGGAGGFTSESIPGSGAVFGPPSQFPFLPLYSEAGPYGCSR